MHRTLGLILLGLCAAVGSGGASAHHSFAMFDQTQCLKLAGTVKAYDFSIGTPGCGWR